MRRSKANHLPLGGLTGQGNKGAEAVKTTGKFGVAALAMIAALAACEREVILEGERFPVRAPLDASLPDSAFASCVNAAPNHMTGEPVPLVAGETYRVYMVMEFACPCGRSDALIDFGIEFAWCQSRFRKLPKPKAESESTSSQVPPAWPSRPRA